MLVLLDDKRELIPVITVIIRSRHAFYYSHHV